MFNLFDAHDADITYYYVSRLQGESSEDVNDCHIHPVEHRELRVSWRYAF